MTLGSGQSIHRSSERESNHVTVTLPRHRPSPRSKSRSKVNNTYIFRTKRKLLKLLLLYKTLGFCVAVVRSGLFGRDVIRLCFVYLSIIEMQ